MVVALPAVGIVLLRSIQILETPCTKQTITPRVIVSRLPELRPSVAPDIVQGDMPRRRGADKCDPPPGRLLRRPEEHFASLIKALRLLRRQRINSIAEQCASLTPRGTQFDISPCNYIRADSARSSQEVRICAVSSLEHPAHRDLTGCSSKNRERPKLLRLVHLKMCPHRSRSER